MTFAGVLCNNTMRLGLLVLQLHAFVHECLFAVCHVQIPDWLLVWVITYYRYLGLGFVFIVIYIDNILLCYMDGFANAKMYFVRKQEQRSKLQAIRQRQR